MIALIAFGLMVGLQRAALGIMTVIMTVTV